MFSNKIRVFLAVLLLLAATGIYLSRKIEKWKGVERTRLDNRFYPRQLDSIKLLRGNLQNKAAAVPELRQQFMKAMTEKIFPYWYGTQWDFNGTTETPNSGSIACGYFVTTTLRDAGVSLNRVKLAQCASEEMIRALVAKKYIYHLSGISIAAFDKKLRQLGKGLYIIGLDNHTGFIHVSDKGNFFIHASGWYPYEVIKQEVLSAPVLTKSSYRVLGKISDDPTFLNNWMGSLH